MQVVLHIVRYRFFDQPLNVQQLSGLLFAAKCPRLAFAAGASRSADSVDVRLRFRRQIVVEHIRDAVDIDPARGDVGGDQHFHLAFAELIQRPGSRRLCLVAMNGRRRNPNPLQSFADTIRLILHLRENDRAPHLRAAENRNEQIILVITIHVQQPLANLLHRRLFGVDRDPGRIDQQALGKDLHGCRQRCGEKPGPAFLWQHGQDSLNVRDKTHIQHAIRLVEYERLDGIELHEPLPHQVEQASRRRDDNIDAAVHRLFLRALSHAAKNHRVGNLQKPAVCRDAVADLCRQLTRRRKDQRPGAAALRVDFLGSQLLEQRDGERGGFAGTGLCAAEQIPAIDLRRNGLGLHRRRR